MATDRPIAAGRHRPSSVNSRRAPLPWSELTRSRLAGYPPLDDDTFLLLNDRVDQLVKLIRDEINAMRLNR